MYSDEIETIKILSLPPNLFVSFFHEPEMARINFRLWECVMQEMTRQILHWKEQPCFHEGMRPVTNLIQYPTMAFSHVFSEGNFYVLFPSS